MGSHNTSFPQISGPSVARAIAVRGPSLVARAKGTMAEGGLWRAVKQLRGIVLGRLHIHVFDPLHGAKEAVSTADPVNLTELDIIGLHAPVDDNEVQYYPTPRAMVTWLLDALVPAPERFTFVDYGSGRGRVLLMAAKRGFARVVGVEFARELHEDAERNIAADLDPAACGRVASVHGDAGAFEPPDHPFVAFFFNPFGAEVMARVEGRLADTLAAQPRDAYILYVNPRHGHVFEASGTWEKVRLPLATRARLALLSPSKVSVYRYADA